MLSWLSLAYMAAEGAIAIIAAVIAGSVALLGFGLDSAIEGLASVIIVWRFTGTRTLSETAEARAQKAVAVSFFLLAPYIVPGHAQQTPVAASPVALAACGPPQHWVACPAGAPSSSAWTVSQRCSPSWPQKVALSARTV